MKNMFYFHRFSLLVDGCVDMITFLVLLLSFNFAADQVCFKGGEGAGPSSILSVFSQ